MVGDTAHSRLGVRGRNRRGDRRVVGREEYGRRESGEEVSPTGRRLPGVAFALAITLPVLPVWAHMWNDVEVDDPIMPGKTCSVTRLLSTGNYIYVAPSKYDLVFWPLVSPEGIWHCAHSGFTAFNDDFDGLSSEELVRIRAYLRATHVGTDDPRTRLELLEGTYRLRAKDVHFENRLLRALARWYQDLGEVEKANGYRRQAFDELTVLLQGELSELRRLQYLYVAANYARQFGDPVASDRYLAQLSVAMEGVSDGVAEQAQYLSQLAKETVRIQPGGILDPTGP